MVAEKGKHTGEAVKQIERKEKEKKRPKSHPSIKSPSPITSPHLEKNP